MPKGVYLRKPRTEEHKQHLSESLKGRPAWNKGISPSLEVCQRISQTLKGNIPWNKDKSPETLKRIELSCKGQHRTPEQKLRMSIAAKHKLIPMSMKCRKAQSRSLKRYWQDPVWRANKIRMSSNWAHTKEARDRIGLTSKRRWANPEYKNRVVRAILEGSYRRPTSAETQLFTLLEDACPNEYKYTGNGKVVINGMSPDFINCNGQKQVIEMYGDYWHRNDNPQDRIDKFREYGFDCLVIWERDLKEQSQEVLLGRIRSFNNA